MMTQYLELGDMAVSGMIAPPAKLLKALAVIATEMHRQLDKVSIVPGWSKRSCVLASLTARDFLRRVGFNARAEAVYLWVRAMDATGKELHSVGVGDHSVIPGQKQMHSDRYNWSGHLVVVVNGWLVDTTLYQIKKSEQSAAAWPSMPGMMATQWGKPDTRMAMLEHDGTHVFLRWLPQPHNNRGWRGGEDTSFARRRPAVDAMVAAFGEWKEAA